jgi:hypothetical protein
LLPNVNKTFKRGFLIIGVQQPEDIFSIVRTNLCAWLGSGAKLRKSGNYCIRASYIEVTEASSMDGGDNCARWIGSLPTIVFPSTPSVLCQPGQTTYT